MPNQDSESVAALGKCAPSEYTPDELVEWIALFNNIHTAKHIQMLRQSVYKAINEGELTLRGNPYHPISGICIFCGEKHVRQQTINKKDAEDWCRKVGLSFGVETHKRQRQHELSSGTEEHTLQDSISENDITVGCKILIVVREFLSSFLPKLPEEKYRYVTRFLHNKKLSENGMLKLLNDYTKNSTNKIEHTSTTRRVMQLARKRSKQK